MLIDLCVQQTVARRLRNVEWLQAQLILCPSVYVVKVVVVDSRYLEGLKAC